MKIITKIKFRLTKNKQIKKDNYTNRDEFRYDKHTDLVPKKNNRLLCIMFSEERGCHFIYRSFNPKIDHFRFNNGLYMIDSEAINVTNNSARVSFYMEGISTPLKLSNIERETKTIEYKDLYGNVKTSIIQKIKGLKFDAKILDNFANRRFAELFTKQPVDNFQLFLLIFGIITLSLVIVNCIVSYFRV